MPRNSIAFHQQGRRVGYLLNIYDINQFTSALKGRKNSASNCSSKYCSFVEHIISEKIKGYDDVHRTEILSIQQVLQYTAETHFSVRSP